MTNPVAEARRLEQKREEDQRRILKKWQDARAVGFPDIVLQPQKSPHEAGPCCKPVTA